MSASRAALLGACAYPFREGSPWEDKPGRGAIQGDEFHKLMVPIVRTLDGAIPGKASKWLERRMVHAMSWVTTNAVSGWKAEAAFAYDPHAGTGRLLGYDIGREYEKHGKLPHEIAGSADIAWLSGDTVEIRDWKTGRTIGAGCESQMEWLALFAARAMGAWYARAVALHVTETGVVETEWFFDDLQLWRIAEQIQIDVNAIEDAWPTAGSHCDNCYCPSRAGCDLYQLTIKGERHDQVA